MLDKEIMPLITDEEISNIIQVMLPDGSIQPSSRYVSQFHRNIVSKQRDADLKVLQTEIAWLENAWRDYLKAKEKEWREKEAGIRKEIASRIRSIMANSPKEIDHLIKELEGK